ncbi:hypothetical protein LAZ67_5002691 [Cordylochernes scorpioides]|uniref:Uncharacterized protein n=1 Tax=Cordylochernes scorpioides TaxID=51811 RepID=A0ABY6KJN7_9ARAC|nr:hypothetical protein LAZ67_5002691 [Cordylochernes scorpioides]
MAKRPNNGGSSGEGQPSSGGHGTGRQWECSVERFFANKTRAFDHTALQLAKVETVSEIDKQEKVKYSSSKHPTTCLKYVAAEAT